VPEGKVTFINAVAQKLTGYNKEEAVNKPMKEIFQIFNEITGEKVENPVEKVLQKAGGSKTKAAKMLGIHRNTLLQIEKKIK